MRDPPVGMSRVVWLTIVNGRRVIAVVMHGHLARRWVEVVRESDVVVWPVGLRIVNPGYVPP